MTFNRFSRLRRALLIVCAAAAVWAMAVILTGGFVADVFGVTVSSRNARNPALLALLSGVVAWALPSQDRWGAVHAGYEHQISRFLSLSERWPALRHADAAGLMAVVGLWLLASVWASGRPLWVDEQMVALNIRDRSLTELAGSLWLGQSAPYGWLALQRVMVLGLGTGEVAMRFVPVLFGGLTLIVALWAGRRWMSPVGAAVFATLCAFGPWLAHYPLELKHYSADAFWGLLLPVLAVWTLETDDETRLVPRAGLWWTAAAVGHWLANGALLVMPGCAVLLWVVLWRRAGWRAGLAFSGLGVVWLALFGLHYVLAIRPALGSPFLRDYWAAGFPPPSMGMTAIVAWLGARLEPLAAHPGGTGLWATFWLVAICGFAIAPRPLGAFLAAVPLCAFALSIVRVVPLHDRLALWIVPALYLGVALFADSSVGLARAAFTRRSGWRLLVALGVASVALTLTADIFVGGRAGHQSRRAPESNHGVDDRAAVRWLMEQRQLGDALITTHLGLPALWWYGELPLSGGDPPGSRHPDGGAILEAGHAAGPDCPRNDLRNSLAGARRVLVYTGFPDQPAGFHELLLEQLSQLGAVIDDRAFADTSRAAVVDLTGSPGASGRAHFTAADAARRSTPALDGCVAVRPGARW